MTQARRTTTRHTSHRGGRASSSSLLKKRTRAKDLSLLSRDSERPQMKIFSLTLLHNPTRCKLLPDSIPQLPPTTIGLLRRPWWPPLVVFWCVVMRSLIVCHVTRGEKRELGNSTECRHQQQPRLPAIIMIRLAMLRDPHTMHAVPRYLHTYPRGFFIRR